MAHLSEGTLRRMVDDPDTLSGAEASHHASCPSCQARSAAMAEDARAVATLLAVPEPNVDVRSAFDRVRAAPAAKPRFGFRLPILHTAPRPILGGLAAAAVLVVVFGSGLAQELLTLFQPTQVQAVPVKVADIQSLTELGSYGTLTWTTPPQPQLVASAAEAATVSGMKVPAIGVLPAGVSSTVTYGAMPKAVGLFTFSANMAAASAAKSGKVIPAMPAGMDGSTLTITVGPAVVEIFGDMKSNPASTSGSGSTSDSIPNLPQMIVAESSSPSVTSTGVSVKQIEDYLLAQPGITPALAASIRSIAHPESTLPIPIPIEYVTSTSIKLHNNISALALGDNTGLGSAVVWIHNGVIYGVAGTVKQDAAIDVANELT